MNIIAAHGATVQNIMGTGSRGLVVAYLLRADAGYAVKVDVIGQPTAPARHFVNIAEAEAAYDLAVRGMWKARSLYGN